MTRKPNLHIESVMHPMPHSIGVDQNLAKAKTMMAEHTIRHLPVQKGGDLVGILSDRDIQFALAVERVDAEQLLVDDAYTRDPYVVAPDETVEVVARFMAHQYLGCALIVDKGKLVGIFTTTDVCRVLAESLSGRFEQ